MHEVCTEVCADLGSYFKIVVAIIKAMSKIFFHKVNFWICFISRIYEMRDTKTNTNQVRYILTINKQMNELQIMQKLSSYFDICRLNLNYI